MTTHVHNADTTYDGYDSECLACKSAVKCRVCDAAMLTEHGAVHIQQHRDAGDIPTAVASHPMRDILAALLRSRGYKHDDAGDPYDMAWGHDKLGVRPLLACVAYEISCETGHDVEGWDTYNVSVAHAKRGNHAIDRNGSNS